MASDDTPYLTDPAPLAVKPTIERGSALRGRTRVGSYAIAGLLGSGGMGEVYRAVDERLRRDVAIKVVRLDLLAAAQAQVARDRLLREAQAMARLSHPNVVTVYEAGLFDDQVFIAMELVEGQTLRAWLDAEPRGWREVLELFLAAGRGLAAAHEQELVHRDFKPENVLVGDDGRARVTDFGLAGTPSEHTDALISTAGTPAYMAPEQHEGLPLDARGDQFAFCVALWDALYQQHPFAGETVEELKASVLSGKLVTPSDERGVPGRIQRALARGLAREPGARFPSVDALLEELARDPAAARRRAAAALAFVALGGVAVFGLARGRSGEKLCRGAEQRLAGVWDAPARASLAQSFEKSGQPQADETYQRVAAALDGWAAGWVAMRTEACQATARGEQSQALLDLRMQCLDRRAAEVGALVAVLAAKVDRDLYFRAVPAARSLGDVRPCGDAAALASVMPPPPDAATRQAVAALRGRIDAARARKQAGRFKDALAEARQITAGARPLDYAPLEAEALKLLAEMADATGDWKGAEAAYQDGLAAAARAHDDPLAAEMARGLMYTVGHREERWKEGVALFPAAAAAAARAGNAPRLLARLYIETSAVLAVAHDYPRADFYLELGIALEEHGGVDELERAKGFNTLAILRKEEGRLGEARQGYQRVIALWERTLGPEHPWVAGVFMNLANLEREAGDYEAAERASARAIATWERDFGPEHPTVARMLTNVGRIRAFAGRYAEAHAAYARALAIKEKVLGPDDPDVANTLINVGELLQLEGRWQDAIVVHERALAIAEKQHGPEHPEVARNLLNLGVCWQGLGDLAKARQSLERGRGLMERALGPDNEVVAEAWHDLADVELEAQRLDAADEDLARALAVDEKVFGPASPRVAADLELGGQILDARGRHDEAQRAYARAIEMLEHAGGKQDADLASPLTGLGESLLAARRPAEARPALERALALRGDHGGGFARAAETRFAAARAAWDTGDRERGLALARQARDALAPLGAPVAKERGEIEAWLRSR